MNDEEEKKLRDAFARLRAADARRLPPFEAMKAAPRPRPLRTAWVIAAPALMAAAAAWVAVCSFSAQESDRRAAVAPTLMAPTSAGAPNRSEAQAGPEPLPLDFLLDTTLAFPRDSRAFLTHVPDFDSDPVKGLVP